MALHTGLLTLETEGGADVVDLTEGVRRVVAASGVAHGVVSVFVGGSTAAVTTMDCEPGGVADLRELVAGPTPSARASLVGPSLTVPVVAGALALGAAQQIVLIDFDDAPRRREVHVQVVA